MRPVLPFNVHRPGIVPWIFDNLGNVVGFLPTVRARMIQPTLDEVVEDPSILKRHRIEIMRPDRDVWTELHPHEFYSYILLFEGGAS
jgi:hypothetical protein